MASKRRSQKAHRGAADQLCKIGTLAHNRPFTSRDFEDYAGPGSDLMLFKRKGWLRVVEGRKLYPTAKGWRAIEIACALKRG
jgi:hypothetical protein